MYPYIYSTAVRVPDNTYNPVGNWPLASNLNDVSGNGFNLSVDTGVERYSFLYPTLPGFQFDGSTRLIVSSFQAGLALTGASSFISLCVLNEHDFVKDITFVSHSGVGETEATNMLYSFTLATNRTTHFLSESGAGVNSQHSVNSWMPVSVPTLIGFTRSAPSGGSSTVQLYVNGRAFGSSGSVTTPTGGTSGNFRLGGFSVNMTKSVMAGAAFYNTELTAAQMTERFNYCLGQYYGYI